MTSPSFLRIGRRSGGTQDPSRDWLALLALFFIGLAIIVVWNLSAFDTVSKGGMIGSPSSSMGGSSTNTSLEALQSVFANRAAEAAKYTNGTYRFADPSQ